MYCLFYLSIFRGVGKYTYKYIKNEGLNGNNEIFIDLKKSFTYFTQTSGILRGVLTTVQAWI